MLKSAFFMFLVSCLLGQLDSTGQTELTVKRGADATLQCSGYRDAAEIMIRWNKPDLQSDGYLLYFKDGQFQKELQYEVFKGRVELKDPDWKKTGNLSVILKHVTTNDAGTYECHAGFKGQKPELLNSLILKVEKPRSTGGLREDGGNEGEEKEEEGKEHVSDRLKGGVVGFIFGVVVGGVAVVGFMNCKKKCRNIRTLKNSYHVADTNL